MDTLEITPVLSDAEMRELGFTDRYPDRWYRCVRVDDATTLNISIQKATGEYTEDVLNEFFGQPEYYGNMREPFRTQIRDAIDVEIARLRDAGLMVSVDHSLYAFESAHA